jgi:LmbE family N-acetylglucosaminyl deacetylase
VLGLRSVEFLDTIDGMLDQADPAHIIASIAGHIRRLRPHIVLTFDPSGIYGHPDHIAISQFTTAAVVQAADSDFVSDAPPYRVSKLYYRAWNVTESQAFESAFGDMVMRVDGVDRRTTVWPEWSITTRLDTAAYTNQVWRAVECHRSQLPGLERLLALPEDARRDIFSTQTFYRALSFVNGGREIEPDLFAGISLPMSLP